MIDTGAHKIISLVVLLHVNNSKYDTNYEKKYYQ